MFLKKWPPVAILDVQKSLCITFLTISDQYHNFNFCEVFLQNGCQRPFWMSENHFRSHFWPFQINTQFFFIFFYKMAALGHFGCPKFTFDHISGYSRSIQIFYFCNFFLQNGCRWPFWMSENHFRSHFWPFKIDTTFIFDKMAAVHHFGCSKFTLDHISGYFRSIQIFFTKWLPVAILDVRKSLSISFQSISHRYATLIFFEIFDKMADIGHFGCPNFTFDRISGHFRSIRNFNFFFNFLQNGWRRPFWMSEIHFRSHFWPFQIDMQL